MTDAAPPPQQSGNPPVSWAPPTATPPPTSGEKFDINAFLSFRYLITPALVSVIYFVGAMLITLAAVGTLAQRNGAVAGILIFIFGNLYWRVILEFIMVLFRMNDSLQSIERRGRGM
jgi:hypothetical protein